MYTFEQWMDHVDVDLSKLTGMTSAQILDQMRWIIETQKDVVLRDYPYRHWFNMGITFDIVAEIVEHNELFMGDEDIASDIKTARDKRTVEVKTELF